MSIFSTKVASVNKADITQQKRRVTDNAPTTARIRKIYERPASFTNLLPWLEYSAKTQSFLLDDGFSVGALFKINTVGSEARTEQFLIDLRDKLQTVLTSLPEELESPWVFQLYLQDEPDLSSTLKQVTDYVHPRAQGSELTQAYLAELAEHLNVISKPGGLFEDKLVTGNAWRGQRRTIRATLYRRRKPTKAIYDYHNISPKDELNDAVSKLTTSLLSAGIKARRCGGEELYEWMFRWFKP